MIEKEKEGEEKTGSRDRMKSRDIRRDEGQKNRKKGDFRAENGVFSGFRGFRGRGLGPEAMSRPKRESY
jgi:hypothetical protein